MVHISADMLVRLFSQAALVKIALAKAFGLNPVQLMTVLLVGEGVVGISIKELRERLIVPGSSLTFTLDSLERMRLIGRSRSKDDRRQWHLSLTEKGKRLYRDIAESERQAVDPKLMALNESDRESFVRISEQLLRAGDRPVVPPRKLRQTTNS